MATVLHWCPGRPPYKALATADAALLCGIVRSVDAHDTPWLHGLIRTHGAWEVAKRGLGEDHTLEGRH